MAALGKSADLRFILNSAEVNAPIEWQDIELVADFTNDSIQANITADAFTFTGEARQAILAYIEAGGAGGLGVFEGMPFQIEAYSVANTLTVFDGFIDFREGFTDFPESDRFEAQIGQKASLASIEKRLEAITFAYLKQQGFIADADYTDVKYVVIKPNQAVEILISSIVLFIMVQQIRQQIRELQKDAATVAGYIAGSLTGGLGAIVYAIAALIFQIAYTAAIAVALAKLATTLINALYPVRLTHKAISLHTALSKAFAYLGYGFESSISELQFYTYLPSNLNVDVTGIDAALQISGRITNGIPNARDYGYLVTEMLDLAKRLFKAKYAVVDGVVQFHWEGSPYWLRTATYVLPSLLIERTTYNTQELVANTLLSFDTDLADEWTIANFKGTNFEAILSPIVTRSDKETNLVRGLNQVAFPVCLGNRKDSKTVLESIVDAVNNFLKSIASIFKQRISVGNILETNGVLKVATNNHSKPKLLYINSNGMPKTHRELLSARYLWANFHYYDSFGPPFQGQKRNFDGVRVPFGLSDFVELANNSYFTDANGSLCKATQASWRIGSDYAVLNYWTREIYTRNLQLTEIEP